MLVLCLPGSTTPDRSVPDINLQLWGGISMSAKAVCVLGLAPGRCSQPWILRARRAWGVQTMSAYAEKPLQVQ